MYVIELVIEFVFREEKNCCQLRTFRSLDQIIRTTPSNIVTPNRAPQSCTMFQILLDTFYLEYLIFPEAYVIERWWVWEFWVELQIRLPKAVYSALAFTSHREYSCGHGRLFPLWYIKRQANYCAKPIHKSCLLILN